MSGERESWNFSLRTSCSTCWKRLITAAFSSGCITARLLLLKTSPDQLVVIVLTQVLNCVSSDGEYFYSNSPPYKPADFTSQQTNRFHWLLFCWHHGDNIDPLVGPSMICQLFPIFDWTIFLSCWLSRTSSRGFSYFTVSSAETTWLYVINKILHIWLITLIIKGQNSRLPFITK